MQRIRDVVWVAAASGTIAVATAFAASTAAAAVLHVGAGCQYTTLADAVAAAKAHAGADIIGITGNLSITAMVTIRDADPLTIEGGYASCAAATSSGTHSTLDANNLSLTSSVIYQSSDNGSGSTIGGNLTLKHLNIRNANSNIDPTSDLYGGAVYASLASSPSGTLSLIDVSIDHNNAGYGAGVYIEGSDQAHAKLNVSDALFEYNNANFDGAGIYAANSDIMIGGDTEIRINNAGAAGGGDGNGGGVYAENTNIAVKGHTPTDRYFLSSNTADYGGGLYLTQTAGGDYEITMQSDRADQPLVVDNNTANFVGGGFYLYSFSATEQIKSNVTLWNMIFHQNFAVDGRGAALFIYADNGNSNQNVSTKVLMKQTDPGRTIPPPCAAGLACNALDSNQSSASASYDSIVHLDAGPTRTGGAIFELSRGRIRDNTSQWSLVRGDGDVYIDNSLIASNQITQSAMFAMDHAYLQITNTTIAGNLLSTAPGNVQSVAYYDSGSLEFFHNLVDQPGNHVCWPATVATAAPLVVDLGVTANTITTECGGTNVQQGDPAFVDPMNTDALQRDFHLKINSQAKDRWSAGGGALHVPTFDLDGATRPAGSGPTPYDFGAYEYGAGVDRIFIDGFDPIQ